MKPKVLYKYRGLSQYTEDILQQKRIWLSKLEDLNDPFEGSVANFSDQIKRQMVCKYRQMQILSFVIKGEMAHQQGKSFFGIRGKVLKSFLKKLKTKSQDRRYCMMNQLVAQNHGVNFSKPEQILKSFESRIKNVGVFSMSESDTDQLMWAHYADESKGLALGFAVEEGNQLADGQHCFPITYSDVIPKFTSEELSCNWQLSYGDQGIKIETSVPFDDPVFLQVVLTKTTAWQYEHEWRYIEETSGLHDYPGRLTEVIFGLRCPENERKKYKRLVRDNFDYPIQFYEIKKVQDSSQLRKIVY